MGWPSSLFTAAPDPNLICPICHDVLEEPIPLQCGHNFCRSCLLRYQEATTSNASAKFSFKGVSITCPTCRNLAVIDDQSLKASPIVKSIIENLHVRCKKQFDREETIKEQERNSISDSPLQIKCASVDDCDWEGTLSEYNTHVESSCPLAIVNCKADGCTSRHLRGYTRSGYCQNSECVVISARSVLEKKKRLDARVKSSSSEGKGSKDTDAVSPLTTRVEVANKNKCENGAPGLSSPQKKVFQKQALTKEQELPLENQHAASLAKTNATSLSTRVLVHAKSPDFNNPSVDSACENNNIKVIPTEGVIRDPIMNSLRFTTDLAARGTSLANATSLSRVDSFASSHIDTVDGTLDSITDTNHKQGSGETSGDSKKIMVTSKKNEPRNNDPFIFAAVKVLVDKELAKLQDLKCKQLDADSMQEMFVDQYIIGFCRSWIRHKPCALFDFVVYRPKIQSNQRTKKLMVGVPGPKRTDWEGGLYPVVIEWTDVNLPPVCKFPKDFHHANICPVSGTAMLSTFSIFEWHPEIIIPEIMFDLQQLLAHPNHKDVLFDVDSYNFKVRIQSSMYSPRSLLDRAVEIDRFGDSNTWQLVDGEALFCGDRRQHNISSIRIKEPAPNGSPSFNGYRDMCKAKCSCCAYGQSLWDEKHEMRFLFGTGMFSSP